MLLLRERLLQEQQPCGQFRMNMVGAWGALSIRSGTIGRLASHYRLRVRHETLHLGKSGTDFEILSGWKTLHRIFGAPVWSNFDKRPVSLFVSLRFASAQGPANRK